MSDAPIRRATAEDGPACAAIVFAWLGETEWMPDKPSLEVLTDALTEGLPKREAYVIGEPVQGYLAMEAEIAHIHGFYVSAKGQGLGKALLDHVKDGRDYLRLNTHAANAHAHRFYEREGFVKTGAPWRGSDGIDEIRMEWYR